jgi:hypothetical protein
MTANGRLARLAQPHRKALGGRSGSLRRLDDRRAGPELTPGRLADTDVMRRLHASDLELAHGETGTQEDLDAAMQRRHATS